MTVAAFPEPTSWSMMLPVSVEDSHAYLASISVKNVMKFLSN
jgi:hypothetical protein